MSCTQSAFRIRPSLISMRPNCLHFTGCSGGAEPSGHHGGHFSRVGQDNDGRYGCFICARHLLALFGSGHLQSSPQRS